MSPVWESAAQALRKMGIFDPHICAVCVVCVRRRKDADAVFGHAEAEGSENSADCTGGCTARELTKSHCRKVGGESHFGDDRPVSKIDKRTFELSMPCFGLCVGLLVSSMLAPMIITHVRERLNHLNLDPWLGHWHAF